ncbi:MAG: Asp-tRNA(Asn)/Glu-tRNA(Gln) amidotransferase subunit GatC [Candidatus Omnitrophica bacterium]|nr:Asp-tRNA(Asn)/Glu-tRNA(Gln) amidotransferase subunit GatC [Candidatus Omnitrophota bacterium]
MINKETVNYVGALARLHIDPQNADRFAKNLEDILHYVEKLNTLDVSSVKPTSHVLDVENVFREDTVIPSLSQDKAMGFAVEHHKGFYKVAKVIE